MRVTSVTLLAQPLDVGIIGDQELRRLLDQSVRLPASQAELAHVDLHLFHPGVLLQALDLLLQYLRRQRVLEQDVSHAVQLHHTDLLREVQ
eukprot:2409187-Pyramimonas_sp.AAC.1